jgi:hypothetical protein
LNR